MPVDLAGDDTFVDLFEAVEVELSLKRQLVGMLVIPR